MPVSELFYRADDLPPSMNRPSTTSDNGEDHDDDELPFSAEQSDSISVTNNKLSRDGSSSNSVAAPKQQRNKAFKNRTKTMEGRESIIRRGMEMLVGGVPVQADPPMRYVQLTYDESANDWVQKISLNTGEYGPLLNEGSVVSDKERRIYSEFFCQSGLKWNLLPDDLRDIVKTHKRETASATSPVADSAVESGSTPSYETNEDDDAFDIKGEFTFEIGISRKELLECETNADFLIFRDVIERAFRDILAGATDSPDEAEEFDVKIPSLTIIELESWYSAVKAEFKVMAGHDGLDTKHFRRIKQIGAAFTTAMDEGKIAVAIASAALKEKAWPKELRARIAEECLFQGDDEESEEPFEEEADDFDMLYVPVNEKLVLPSDSEVEKAMMNEQFRGGGLGGIFDDFTDFDEPMAPFQGQLGPRLLDAVAERAKMREPRVIAIGDVHGCIDELQELLRRCDYRPGDLVLFLGDLVCKGPDSLAVVQLAREIGAIGVRGNHDFEVVRWHQAILAGVDQPVFGSEHFHIVSLPCFTVKSSNVLLAHQATCLSKADLKWLYSLPWYISSPSLQALFVHAGFVSGIKLSKQNPRLMLNMR
jgi:predicted phosphodiesterase